MRRKLDDLILNEGDLVRVYLPHGREPETMRVTGNVRPSGHRVAEFDWELCPAAGGHTEWVPGWVLGRLERRQE